jgi:hypothetical protein
MADKKNIGNDQRSGNSIQVLMEAAQTITACRKNIQEAAETIVASCYTQGTKGEDHRSMLLDKADGMESLAELYRSVAKRFESAAMKLVSGVPEDKVWADVLAYNTFFADQLESEKNSSESVLNILQENTT